MTEGSRELQHQISVIVTSFFFFFGVFVADVCDSVPKVLFVVMAAVMRDVLS